MSILLKEYPIKDSTQSVVEYAGAVARAALKKVVGEIKSNAYVALDKRTGEVELGSVIISPEFWEKLLKEIE